MKAGPTGVKNFL